MKTRLRLARMTCGLTQIELARNINLNRATLSGLECRKIVAAEKHKQTLEKVLNVPASELFDENNLARL